VRAVLFAKLKTILPSFALRKLNGKGTRYVFFVGNEGIVSRIALTMMMRQWIRSFAIIVGKLGIPLLCAANLFKMEELNLLIASYVMNADI